MREVVSFIASLAGAAVLTAMAVLLQPASPVWKWLLSAAIAAFLACAAVLLVDLAKPGTSRLLLGGMGIGLAVFVLCSIGVLTGLPTPGSTATLGAVPDFTISFQCDMTGRPTKRREDRRLYTGEIIGPPTNPDAAKQMLGWVFLPPGTGDITWPDDIPQTMLRCSLINYGSAPVFDVYVELEISWREKVETAQGTGTEAGNVIATAKYDSPKFSISPGPANEEYFYIMNLTDSFIIIPPPTLVFARYADGDKPAATRLIQGSSDTLPWFGLLPRSSVANRPPRRDAKSAPVGEFAGLTNAQLREKTIAFAVQMRNFELSYKRANNAALQDRWIDPNLSPDEKDKAWSKYTQRLTDTQNEWTTKFKNEMRSDAMALRDELLQRLGSHAPGPRPHSNPDVALDHGMLAGVSPVSDVADYLEALARALP